MDNKLKRRTFLTVVIGTLLGTPVAIRVFRGDKQHLETHRFTQELQRMRSLTHVPVQSTDGPSSLKLTLTPPIGQSWNYAIFAPSFLPKEFSHALGDEPDMFLAREGNFSANQTNRGQIVLTGRDTIAILCSPLNMAERPRSEMILLVRDGELRMAEPKGEVIVHHDQQFSHLLSLAGGPQELAVGKKWKSNTGRIKPFEHCPTEYEVAGFAEVVGRQTVNIRFEGSIPNVAQLPGVNLQKPDKDASMTNEHEGNAYFDLETGLLIRQETTMSTTVRSKEIATRNGDSMTVKADSIIQFFPV